MSFVPLLPRHLHHKCSSWTDSGTAASAPTAHRGVVLGKEIYEQMRMKVLSTRCGLVTRRVLDHQCRNLQIRSDVAGWSKALSYGGKDTAIRRGRFQFEIVKVVAKGINAFSDGGVRVHALAEIVHTKWRLWNGLTDCGIVGLIHFGQWAQERCFEHIPSLKKLALMLLDTISYLE